MCAYIYKYNREATEVLATLIYGSCLRILLYSGLSASELNPGWFPHLRQVRTRSQTQMWTRVWGDVWFRVQFHFSQKAIWLFLNRVMCVDVSHFWGFGKLVKFNADTGFNMLGWSWSFSTAFFFSFLFCYFNSNCRQAESSVWFRHRGFSWGGIRSPLQAEDNHNQFFEHNRRIDCAILWKIFFLFFYFILISPLALRTSVGSFMRTYSPKKKKKRNKKAKKEGEAEIETERQIEREKLPNPL